MRSYIFNVIYIYGIYNCHTCTYFIGNTYNCGKHIRSQRAPHEPYYLSQLSVTWLQLPRIRGYSVQVCKLFLKEGSWRRGIYLFLCSCHRCKYYVKNNHKYTQITRRYVFVFTSKSGYLIVIIIDKYPFFRCKHEFPPLAFVHTILWTPHK